MKFRTVDIMGAMTLIVLSIVGWILIVGPVRTALDESLRLKSAKLDLATSRSRFVQTQNRMRADIDTVEAELESFNPRLLERQRLVVGSKLDAARDRRRDQLAAAAAERRLGYLEVSAVTHLGLGSLKNELRRRLRQPEVATP